MEAIHILAIVDSLDNLLLVDMLGQRQLHDEAIYISILIKLLNLSKKLCLGNIVLET